MHIGMPRNTRLQWPQRFHEVLSLPQKSARALHDVQGPGGKLYDRAINNEERLK